MYEFNPYLNAFELFGTGAVGNGFTVIGSNTVIMTRALDIHFYFDLQAATNTALNNAITNSIYRVPQFARPPREVYAECPYSRNDEYGTCIMRILPDGRMLPINGVRSNGVAPIFYFSKISYNIAGGYYG